ncbi:LDL receptor wingless signaling/trafficking chaperone [Tasmannia lanceolata]|uniref:LDL receptor wingless signaling/trafficking chaperone n=1 Tax=Tasmannia lanceolata TaxID=3420 RepID=UPI0040630FF8
MKKSSLVFFSVLLISILTEIESIHIPDELDDVIDDEEDEAWKEWGKKSKPKDLDPPPDFSQMQISEIQAEIMKRNFGPSFGFVKLQLGVPRSAKVVPEIAMRWTKVLRTGAVEAKFMAVDTNTIMFNMERGQDTEELKDFVLNQPEAYEIKIGDQVYRRPGDPPLDELIETIWRQKSEAGGLNSIEEPDNPKEEL